jgi:ubiquinone/menaquinone biosynthesis C-methylase UbiE
VDKEQYEIMRRLEDSLWWYVGMRRIVSTLLPESCEKDGTWRILDAGCGTGANLDCFSSLGTVYGLDVADEGLQHCQMRGHDRLVKGSVEQLPFNSDVFDLVTSFDVIYHRAVCDDCDALREFHRVLRPGGTIVLRVPAYDWLRGAHDVAVHTKHRYNRGEVHRKLSEAGFQVKRVTYANMFMFPLALIKRLLESRGAVMTNDLCLPQPTVNALLTRVLSTEAHLVRRVSLPWGLSVIGVGVKK